MNAQQREALRQDTLQWIDSQAFEAYFTELHLSPMMLTLACILKPARFNPIMAIRAARQRGLATRSLWRRYRDLASSGQVVLTYTWMANTALVRGETSSAPALLIAGADGTTEADDYVYHITGKLTDLDERPPANQAEAEIQALLNDEIYHCFRVRTLPLSYTENYPVYLFDVMLHNSTVAGGELRELPFIISIVQPQMKPAILPIPMSVAGPHVRTTAQ